VLCRILANASLDLGWLHAAETQARTAFLCAELAGNNALRAWVRGTQSLVAYWDGRLRTAVELAAEGWRYPPRPALHTPGRGCPCPRRAGPRRGPGRGQSRRDAHLPTAKQTWYAATTRLWLGDQANLSRTEQDAASAIQIYETDAPEDRRLGELPRPARPGLGPPRP
jgi:hypothetical protein